MAKLSNKTIITIIIKENLLVNLNKSYTIGAHTTNLTKLNGGTTSPQTSIFSMYLKPTNNKYEITAISILEGHYACC
jgi:hypothetical protein